MAETLTLIPSLPNDLAALILSYIPFSHHARLKSTCKSWRIFLSSKTVFSLRAANFPPSRLSHLIAIFPEDPSITCPYLFDPEYLAWHALPRMPVNPHVYALCNFASLSLGWHLYVLGGSLFDTRSFPMDRPSPSSVAFRFDLSSFAWNQISPMLMPRGSFACTAISDSNQILVAGGGSRHTMFRAAGSRISSVERYDIEKDEWVELDGMPCFRAGCAGFVVGSEEEREFWVMGGYGESRTMLGVFPVDEYYRDAVVMKLKDGGRWKEVGDMWEDGERMRLGKIVVLDEEDDHGVPGIFMLDGNDIFRYIMASNRWLKESCVPRKAPHDSSFGFVALNGELLVMTLLQGVDTSQIRRSRNRKGNTLLYLQIYHPGKKTWRSLVAMPPSNCTLDFTTAVMCTITV
ncbi:hypothetical protein Nepgr_029816 [Nepenthes gracilis]|uniref:F-box domain-containing protein n=1 Tax=Nepenthes gracilis TaxID=150966 RepID=A0AAD3Y3K8_NEPGR|nr:hypothetical protein Nepgr_029816 [Nepenthes gracilis]